MRYRESLQKKHQVTRLCTVIKKVHVYQSQKVKAYTSKSEKWNLIAKIETLYKFVFATQKNNKTTKNLKSVQRLSQIPSLSGKHEVICEWRNRLSHATPAFC